MFYYFIFYEKIKILPTVYHPDLLRHPNDLRAFHRSFGLLLQYVCLFTNVTGNVHQYVTGKFPP